MFGSLWPAGPVSDHPPDLYPFITRGSRAAKRKRGRRGWRPGFNVASRHHNAMTVRPVIGAGRPAIGLRRYRCRAIGGGVPRNRPCFFGPGALVPRPRRGPRPWPRFLRRVGPALALPGACRFGLPSPSASLPRQASGGVALEDEVHLTATASPYLRLNGSTGCRSESDILPSVHAVHPRSRISLRRASSESRSRSTVVVAPVRQVGSGC